MHHPLIVLLRVPLGQHTGQNKKLHCCLPPSAVVNVLPEPAVSHIARAMASQSSDGWSFPKVLDDPAGVWFFGGSLYQGHVLGRLRVRGGERVRLEVYLKALACNVKRMVRSRLTEMLVPPAALATVPPTA